MPRSGSTRIQITQPLCFSVRDCDTETGPGRHRVSVLNWMADDAATRHPQVVAAGVELAAEDIENDDALPPKRAQYGILEVDSSADAVRLLHLARAGAIRSATSAIVVLLPQQAFEVAASIEEAVGDHRCVGDVEGHRELPP
jgi:hypothetical protein